MSFTKYKYLNHLAAVLRELLTVRCAGSFRRKVFVRSCGRFLVLDFSCSARVVAGVHLLDTTAPNGSRLGTRIHTAVAAVQRSHPDISPWIDGHGAIYYAQENALACPPVRALAHTQYDCMRVFVFLLGNIIMPTTCTNSRKVVWWKSSL